MKIVVTTAPAIEPVTVQELKAWCRIDSTNAEPAPGVIASAALANPAAPGNVDNGAHRYLATFVTADGETDAGVATAAVTVVDKTVNGQVALTGMPLGGAAVTARKLYRTASGGSTYLLLATIADNTTTAFTDNLADASLGAGAPATNTTGDGLLAMIIAATRRQAEQELDRALITQTLTAYLDGFPGAWTSPDRWAYTPNIFDYAAHRWRRSVDDILLPPLQTVNSVKYYDTSGVQQTLNPTAYLVDASSAPARLAPAPSTSWPATQERPNTVAIEFVAGYGAAAASVPACVRHWMMLRAKTLYDNREAIVIGEGRVQMAQIDDTFVDSLLDSERVVGWR